MGIQRFKLLPSADNDLEVQALPELKWSSSEAEASIRELFRWVEYNALLAQNWYLTEKSGKKRMSKVIRASSIVLLTIGSLVPIVSLAAPKMVHVEWGYALLIIGAGVILLDRVFGFSSAWNRYMRTSAYLNKIIVKYQLEWSSWETSKPQDPIEAASIAIRSILIPFTEEISLTVEDETLQWASEFTANLEQLRSSLSTNPP